MGLGPVLQPGGDRLLLVAAGMDVHFQGVEPLGGNLVDALGQIVAVQDLFLEIADDREEVLLVGGIDDGERRLGYVHDGAPGVDKFAYHPVGAVGQLRQRIRIHERLGCQHLLRKGGDFATTGIDEAGPGCELSGRGGP